MRNIGGIEPGLAVTRFTMVIFLYLLSKASFYIGTLLKCLG